MLKINQIFTSRFIIIIISVFLFSSLVTFFFIETGAEKSVDELKESFFYLWLSLSVTFFSLITLIIVTVKMNLKKLENDTQELTKYIDDVSKKVYDSKLEIKHYYELLHISVLLKNLVKRVNKREKKGK